MTAMDVDMPNPMPNAEPDHPAPVPTVLPADGPVQDDAKVLGALAAKAWETAGSIPGLPQEARVAMAEGILSGLTANYLRRGPNYLQAYVDPTPKVRTLTL